MAKSTKNTKCSPKSIKIRTAKDSSNNNIAPDALMNKEESQTKSPTLGDLATEISLQQEIISSRSEAFNSKLSCSSKPPNTAQNMPVMKAETNEGRENLAHKQLSTNNGPPKKKNSQPLAERMRPTKLEDYMGQEHILGRGKMMRELLMAHNLPSLILWGPPGCGKTTLAKIIAARCKETHDTRFVSLSATTAGVADVKEIVKVAKNELRMLKRKTILFVDEIHRFNKLQQDTFLPHIEDGTIVLVGATTENPSFHVNNALLSRCKLLTLEKLTALQIEKVTKRALKDLEVTISEPQDDSNLGAGELSIDPVAVTSLANHCDGDARAALNTIQDTVEARRAQLVMGNSSTSSRHISVDDIKESLQRSHVQYDRNGEEHYNCASALQKSIRGSDDNGAIYWMTRMLEGGEDPMFIARRLVVCASEDIGLADIHALPLAVACQQACHLIGKPECAINLAHCVTYLARAPKSNESYRGLSKARESIREYDGPLPGVPLHLRNASTSVMKKLGYGKGYKYSHNYSETTGKQEYLPQQLSGLNFFQ